MKTSERLGPNRDKNNPKAWIPEIKLLYNSNVFDFWR